MDRTLSRCRVNARSEGKPIQHDAEMPHDRQTFFAIDFVKSFTMNKLKRPGMAHVLKKSCESVLTFIRLAWKGGDL